MKDSALKGGSGFHQAEIRRDRGDDSGHQFGVLKLFDLP
jgi:hypothetical protein